MTSAVPADDADFYAVPYRADRAVGSPSFSAGLRLATGALATLLGVAISGGFWWLALQDAAGLGMVVIAVVMTVVMAATVWVAWRPVRVAAQRRRHLAQARDAMQISADGVGFPDLDSGAWIVVPWSAINGARVMTWREVRFLHLEVSPDLRGDEPGAKGLDDPAVLRGLVRPAMGLVGPRFSLAGLQRTPEEIDAALRHYSGGRVVIT